MPSRARFEIIVHIGQTIRASAIFCIRIQGKNFEIYYIVDVACSIYLYIVLRRSVLMKGQLIFRTNFSYFRLSGKCGNIHLT